MDMESELLLAVLEDCWECGYEAPESMTSFKVEGRSGNKKRDRTDVAAKILCLSDNEFKRLYRLDKRDFDDLLDKITPEVSSARHTQQAKNSSGGPVLPVVKLAVTLRFLAGGSHLDIAFTYNVDANYVYPIVWQCAAAIKKTVNNVIFPFGDRPALERLADGFASIKNNGWWGTVAAGDGVVFKMVAPSGKFCNGQVTQFFSRKGFYCFGLQAFCDSNCKLLSVSSQMCTSTHDSTAYIATSVSRAIERSKQMKKNGVPDDQLPLPKDFHIVLDEGYVCDGQQLSPHRGSDLPADKDTFNYFLSLHRQCIERAFGLLTQRWGILWRPLRVKPTNLPILFQTLCKLHNICVDRFGSARGTVKISHNASELVSHATERHPARDPVNMRSLFTDGFGVKRGGRVAYQNVIES